MKIDKKNCLHWLYLLAFLINTVAAVIIRLFIKPQNLVLLYGHKLNGNLKAIYEYQLHFGTSHTEMVFLTMDPVYFRELKAQQVKVKLALSPGSILTLAQTKIVVSDHGLHSLIFALWLSNIKFIDVWHGIPFKGFDKKDFKVQHRYAETWVTSKLLKNIYVTKFGFDNQKVVITGYARTDILVNQSGNRSTILHSLGISDTGKKIILFAPTWKQDDAQRSLFPFNADEKLFLKTLDDIANNTGAFVILRSHLNSDFQLLGHYTHLKQITSDAYPNTEEILYISDLLICDWSSIAFDFLLLDRPTLFLNVPPPFKKGLSLGQRYRFGAKIDSIGALEKACYMYLNNESHYARQYSSRQRAIKKMLYDDYADGHSAQRCCERLEQLLNPT